MFKGICFFIISLIKTIHGSAADAQMISTIFSEKSVMIITPRSFDQSLLFFEFQRKFCLPDSMASMDQLFCGDKVEV